MVIETEKIRKEYGTLVAVNDVDLSFEKGQVIGLIGPNGAGKTTLLRMMATLLHPTSGQLRVLGNDLHEDQRVLRKNIGYLPDFFNLCPDLTLKECLAFFGSAYDIDQSELPSRIDQAIDMVDMQDKCDSMIQNLSRGMVQRMGLATLLVRDPQIYLLDEPASGLDPKARIQLRKVLQTLSEQGKTVVISSHILTELAGFCSHIAIMNHGAVVAFGSVDEMAQRMSSGLKVSMTLLENAEKAAEYIRHHSDAKNIEIDQKDIRFDLEGSVENIADINTMLVKQGFRIISLSENKLDLEDVFLEISSKSNQEEQQYV